MRILIFSSFETRKEFIFFSFREPSEALFIITIHFSMLMSLLLELAWRIDGLLSFRKFCGYRLLWIILSYDCQSFPFCYPTPPPKFYHFSQIKFQYFFCSSDSFILQETIWLIFEKKVEKSGLKRGINLQIRIGDPCKF